MNGSLRGQLGLAVGAGAFVLTVVAALLVGFERWQEESSSLQETVELEAFRLSEIGPGDRIEGFRPGDASGFGLLLDDEAEIVAEVGDVDDDAIDLAREVWSETTEQDVVVSTSLRRQDGTELVVSGVACVEPEVCDTAVAARGVESLVDFLLGRVAWLIGLPVLVAALTVVVARWLVGRALRPVEAMRAEAAAIPSGQPGHQIPNPGTGDELERLATTFNDTLARLAASSAATERFAADAAHELRSPLTGVRAAVELRAGDDDLLADALGELDRAGRLIDDLLLLARSEAGAGATPVEVDLDDLVGQDVAAARARFPDVLIETDLAPARMVADPGRLRRVVTNLIDNGAAHGAGRVVVSLSRVDEGWRLRVDDDGPGIPQADRRRIFERFARLDESRTRSTGGTGLGLALVAEIVTDHNGTVRAERSPLGGARLEVRLPDPPQTRSSNGSGSRPRADR